MHFQLALVLLFAVSQVAAEVALESEVTTAIEATTCTETATATGTAAVLPAAATTTLAPANAYGPIPTLIPEPPVDECEDPNFENVLPEKIKELVDKYFTDKEDCEDEYAEPVCKDDEELVEVEIEVTEEEIKPAGNGHTVYSFNPGYNDDANLRVESDNNDPPSSGGSNALEMNSEESSASRTLAHSAFAGLAAAVISALIF